MSTTGHWVVVAGQWVSATGHTVAVTGHLVSEAGHRVAHTAVHVHGGVGIDMDYPLQRYFVAAKKNEFTLGSSTDQLLRIGSALAAAGGT